LSVGNAAMKKSGSGAITGFSKDSVPAGIRATNASHLTIYGNGFGTLKGDVLMKDANQANYFVALHPTHNILYWSDDSIQIIVPSMGFASNGDEFLGDTRSACAGTGYQGHRSAYSHLVRHHPLRRQQLCYKFCF